MKFDMSKKLVVVAIIFIIIFWIVGVQRKKDIIQQAESYWPQTEKYRQLEAKASNLDKQIQKINSRTQTPQTQILPRKIITVTIQSMKPLKLSSESLIASSLR